MADRLALHVPGRNHSLVQQAVCLALVARHPSTRLNPQCDQTFRLTRCSSRMLGEPPHFATPAHNPALTYAEKACVDRHLQRAIESQTCLVYGVGVAQDWSFERSLAAEGCEVHLFDPTVSHAVSLDRFFPNITFHRLGLASEAAAAYNGSTAAKTYNYGRVEGQLLPLEDIIRRLGHQHRTISVLKVDCEGCEWQALGAISDASWASIGQLVVELHMGTAYDFYGARPLAQAEQLVGRLRTAGMRPWYSEPNVGSGRLKQIWPPLVRAGYPRGKDVGCCWQQGWIRAPSSRVRGRKARPRDAVDSSSSRANGV